MKSVRIFGSTAIAAATIGRAQLLNPLYASTQTSSIETVPIDITDRLSNKGFGQSPGEADFDGSQGSYPAQYHPGTNPTLDGISFQFPNYSTFGYDNFVVLGQNLPVTPGRYLSVHILAAADGSQAAQDIIASYEDGSTTSREVLVPPWWQWLFPPGGDIILPYSYTSEGINYNRTNIFQAVSWLDSTKNLTSLQLPSSSSSNRVHVFAVTLLPAPVGDSGSEPLLEVQYARSTRKWVEGSGDTQIFEVTVKNAGEQAWVLANDTVEVTIESDGVTTVQPGIIKRLRPGDQVIVQVGVENKDGVESGATGTATARLKSGAVDVSHDFDATFGIGTYEPTYESIYSHESPEWFNAAKYGIFIHWGLYSIPAWGNTGANENYAEWYWWYLNQGPNTTEQTYEYHLENYGPDFIYDDFIANFTADAFDPKEWVDLFADAGANYFVHVSKHHDGYALFDLPANVTTRTSVASGPHRNFVKDLFEAAEEYQPQLHRAVYYSLPEWFHPDYAPLGFENWPGGNATNPFTGETLPYAGYVPVEDYLHDKMLPEMQALAALGTEIMWCDIGGPNVTAEFAAQWFNDGIAQDRQLVLNSRCGLPGDFDTPEYTTFSATRQRKWESSEGMDPFSYGYNAATPLDGYMNASTIVTSLVDIVSKNGNFLLDIGPMANGSVLDVEAALLREAGAWIKGHAEAVFNTTYWFVAPQEGDDVRFTTTPDAFYVLVMNQLNASLTLASPIPWTEGDQVTVVGGDLHGQVVPSEAVVTEDGQAAISFEISDEVQAADKWTWVFKIAYD